MEFHPNKIRGRLRSFPRARALDKFPGDATATGDGWRLGTVARVAPSRPRAPALAAALC